MEHIHAISLGAGVQSSVMLLMADRGILKPMPKWALFADTGFEPHQVYEQLEWLEKEVKNIPIIKVSRGNIKYDMIEGKSVSGHRAKDGSAFHHMPLFTEGKGRGRRTCTSNYKIYPMERKIRRLLGIKYRSPFPTKKYHVHKWLGITTDEISRMRVSPHTWETLEYPLIDYFFMSRDQCQEWFKEEYGFELVKSACITCPYRDNESWKEDIFKDEDNWQEAINFDEKIRSGGKKQAFVHDSRRPIKELPFLDKKDPEYSTFEQECAGYCGV